MKKNKNIGSKAQEPQFQYESISLKTDSPAITFKSHKKEHEEILQYQANLSPEMYAETLRFDLYLFWIEF